MPNLRRGFSAIGDQGNLGSCAAFASASILEYLRNRIEGWYQPGQKRSLSPRYIYFNMAGVNGFDYTSQQNTPQGTNPNINNCATHPTHPRDVGIGGNYVIEQTSITANGVCEETNWPYGNDQKCQPRNIQPNYGNAPTVPDYKPHYRESWCERPGPNIFNEGTAFFQQYIERIDIHPWNYNEIIDLVVNQEIPIYIGVDFPGNMHDYPDPYYHDVPDASIGGHAMVIMGYEQNYNPPGGGAPIEAFMIRNSHGQGYADGGYVWVPRTSLDIIRRNQYMVFLPKAYPNHNFVPWPGNPPNNPPAPVAPPNPAPNPNPAPQPQPQGSGEFKYHWVLFSNPQDYNTCRQNSGFPTLEMVNQKRAIPLHKVKYSNRNIPFTHTDQNNYFQNRIIAICAAWRNQNEWIWGYWDGRQTHWGDFAAPQRQEQQNMHKEESEDIEELKEKIKNLPDELNQLDSTRKKAIKELSKDEFRFESSHKLHFHEKKDLNRFDRFSKLLSSMYLAHQQIGINLMKVLKLYPKDDSFLFILNGYVKVYGEMSKEMDELAKKIAPVVQAYETKDQNKVDDLERTWDPQKVNKSLENLQGIYEKDSELLKELINLIKKLPK